MSLLGCTARAGFRGSMQRSLAMHYGLTVSVVSFSGELQGASWRTMVPIACSVSRNAVQREVLVSGSVSATMRMVLFFGFFSLWRVCLAAEESAARWCARNSNRFSDS